MVPRVGGCIFDLSWSQNGAGYEAYVVQSGDLSEVIRVKSIPQSASNPLIESDCRAYLGG